MLQGDEQMVRRLLRARADPLLMEDGQTILSLARSQSADSASSQALVALMESAADKGSADDERSAHVRGATDGRRTAATGTGGEAVGDGAGSGRSRRGSIRSRRK